MAVEIGHLGDNARCLVSKSGDAGSRLKFSFSNFGSADNIRCKACLRFLEGGQGKWPSPDIELFLLIPAMEGTIADHKCFTLHYGVFGSRM